MEKIYHLTMTASNPIVRNHMVNGEKLLPGLAYIDMIYQLIGNTMGFEYQNYSIRKLAIFNPLIIEGRESVKLRISLKEEKGYWLIQAEENSPAKLYMTAELHNEMVELTQRIKIEELKQMQTLQVDLETIYQGARQQGLLHQEMIKAEGSIGFTEAGYLIEVHVNKIYEKEAQNYLFHPTLIDGAAMAAEAALSKVKGKAMEEPLYLPICYEAFYGLEQMKTQCYAMVEPSSFQIKNDIRTMDIKYFNKDGKQIAWLKGIALKQIRVKEPNNTMLAMKTKTIGKNQGVEQTLKKIISQYLSLDMDSIDPYAAFFELGLKSSQLLKLVRELETAFQLSLSPTLLFENSNINELKIYLENEMRDNNSPRNQTIDIRQPAVSQGIPDEYQFYGSEAFLQDHLVYREPALMGVTHPCLALETYLNNNQGRFPVELKNIVFSGGPVTLKNEQIVHIKVQFKETEEGTVFETYQYITDPDAAKICCKGDHIKSVRELPEPIPIEEMLAKSRKMPPVEIDQCYEVMEEFKLGPMLKTIEEAYYCHDSRLIAKINLSGKLKKGNLSGFHFDPLLLNSCYLLSQIESNKKSRNIYIPLAIETLTIFRPMTEISYLIKSLKQKKEGYLSFDAAIVTEHGEVIASVKNASVKEVLDPVALENASFGIALPHNTPLDIAIIGLSGRYPKAYDTNAFWTNLESGLDCISEIPKERWDWKKYYTNDRTSFQGIHSKWGGFLEDYDKFDPLLFSISPREAEMMDPQERLFLEHCWIAMEDAGYTRERLNALSAPITGNVGVYAGVMSKEYPFYAIEANMRGKSFGLGTGTFTVANRVSYFGGFHGPSMAIDTACSSSLTSIYLACQALKTGQIDAAFAGGVNLILHPNKYLMLSQGRFISTKGHCESFGEGGDGYIPGEGVGVLLLKRLEDAKRHRDPIYAVIKGAAINHGGRASGFTVPNPKSQSMVISAALSEAGLKCDRISYIETHGTGTKLGDPIEIAGLNEIFPGDSQQNCMIGSVKSNIGHCESAAGVAGLTKVLLQMKHGKIVPSLHSQSLNPNIDFESTPFIVNQELRDWKREVINGEIQPYRAGLSSFGAGGANAHFILEEYMEEEKRAAITVSQENPAIILLSAKSEVQIREYVKKLLDYVISQNNKNLDLSDIAYTLQIGREAMNDRMAFLACSVSELKEKLEKYLDRNYESGEFYQGNAKLDRGSVSIFEEDEDLENIIHTWSVKRKYNKILELWVKGLSINWNLLYERSCPKRISLPTYPFARERYWIQEEEGVEKEGVEEEGRKEKALLVKRWKEAPVSAEGRGENGAVVLMGTKKTHSLVQGIFDKNAGIHCLEVTQEKENGSLVTDYYKEEEGEKLYEEVLKILGEERLLGVVDVTALDEEYEESLETESGKLRFLQKVIEGSHGEIRKLLQVTCGLSSPEGEVKGLQGARLQGLYRMLGAEYGKVRSAVLDSERGAEKKELKEEIEREFLGMRKEGVTEACCRKGKRYEPYLERVEAGEFGEKREKKENRKEEVVLITGGSRGIGAELAEYVVRNGVRKLVLMGREDLRGESGKEKRRRIEALGEKGATVKYYNVALTDREGLERMKEKVHKELGEITGVYHCAGTSGKNPAFIKKNAEEIRKVCEPKVKGLVTLDRVLKGEPLRFMILFSSVSGVIPRLGAGQSEYGMANSYMDCYAGRERSLGRKEIQSLQWGIWEETGMGAGKKKSRTYEELGLEGHTTKEGLELLEEAGRREEAVLAACMVRKGETDGQELLRLSSAGETKKQGIKKEEIRKEEIEPKKEEETEKGIKEEVKKWIEGIFLTELKLREGQLDEDLSFDEYGVDSIMLAQLTQRLQEKIRQEIDPALLIEYDTIGKLTEYFNRNHESDLRKSIFTGNQDSAEVKNPEEKKQPEIAVVGIACHFPGALDKEAYWHMLREGKTAIKPVPESRWKQRENHMDFAGLMEEAELFDPELFHLTEQDAAIMEPQARIILEESLKAIYDAGYDPGQLSGENVGVYIGGRSLTNLDSETILESPNPILGSSQNYLAANLSKYYNFKGPSVVVDTACSSAITGMQFASDALCLNRIDMAMVGAVSVLPNGYVHQMLEKRKILSKDGQYRIFDKQATGEIPGEGAGVVLLKRLSDAVRDGNQIYGVIKAISMNNDGKTLGPGSPNIDAQKQVIWNALKISGKQSGDIGYIEVNGGGSPIIDSVEIKTLSDMYQFTNRELGSCAIGSVKPNIGHLLLASGIAGFIRCVLSLYKKEIPPFLSAQNPLSYYDFAASRINFNRNCIDWEVEPGKRRIAALNSFPDGGTNGHVLIEEFVPDRNRKQNYFSKEAPLMLKKQLTIPSKKYNDSKSAEGLEEKSDFVKRTVKKIMEKFLKGRVDMDRGLYDLGLQSAQIPSVIEEMEGAFGVSLNPVFLFENKNLSELVLSLRKKVDGESRSIQEEEKKYGSNIRKELDKEEEDIAVIGLSGRYPCSKDLDILWENLCKGKDCIRQIPKERWDWEEYYTKDRTKLGYIFSKWGGFLDGYDEFDPRFFHISPLEAKMMDPQERLFLEYCWMAMEDAGYTREGLYHLSDQSRTAQVGVYVASAFQEYSYFGIESSLRGQRIGMGGGISSIANRVSYFCGFHGPSIALDTACSGSLTAIYLAYKALKDRSIDAALVGGINLTLHPNKYLALSQGQFLSAKGHCESFGEEGDGYIPGEGVGVLLLKRLSEAKEHGDSIYGVIKGAAINHGGKTSGYTVPNPNAHSMLITSALNDAGIRPETISYVEAHGTGTKLGDPIEIAGLTDAYMNCGAKEKQYCYIGSIKSNIGHSEAAAGIAGITKILLQMKYGKIVKSLHSEIQNHNIDFSNTPFIVNQKLRDWDRPVLENQVQPRRAGISSFGAGGANAHVILEEFVDDTDLGNEKDGQEKAVIILSAKTAEQLKNRVKQLLTAIQGELSGKNLYDIAYTLQTGREAMEERLAFMVTSMEELKEKLQWILVDNGEIQDVFRGQVKKNEEFISAFLEDKELREVVHKWIQLRKYERLIEYWVKGLMIDWNAFYQNKPMKRLHLPVYPFAGERYWITDLDPSCQKITMLKPVWKKTPVDEKIPFALYENHMVVLCDLAVDPKEAAERGMEHIEWVCMEHTEESIEKRYEDCVILMYHKICDLLKQNSREKQMVQFLIPNKGIHKLFSGISGFLKTAEMENPGFTGQVIQIDPSVSADFLLKVIKENAAVPADSMILYKDKERFLLSGQSMEIPEDTNQTPWKQNGVYLITGGAGGLGFLFAEEIAKKAKGAAIVLAGRSDLDKTKEAKIKSLSVFGGEISYKQADVADKRAVSDLVGYIREKYGRLDGILHCAGVIHDCFITNKKEEDIRNILRAKVTGVIHLEEATKDFPLDFFILFSSMAGWLGNFGQADYAAANAFMDAFSHYRKGHTISINWPLWRDGGMEMNQKSLQEMEESTGFIPIDTAAGIQYFYKCLTSGENQIMIIAQRDVKNSGTEASEQQKRSDDIKLKGREITENYTEVEKKIGQIWGRLLGMKEIDIDGNFFELGGNSVVSLKMEVEMENIGLEIKYSDLTQYQTIRELAAYASSNVKNKIVPFNDLYYQSCFFNSLFTVVHHFNGTILPFLANDAVVYSGQGRPDSFLRVEYISSKPIEHLLEEQGITVIDSNKKPSQVVDAAKYALKNNRLVIVWIDCYYASIRPDTYHKKHLYHTWLIYGYDGSKDEFTIMEHKNAENLLYGECLVSAGELEEAYGGYMENKEEPLEASYLEFYKNEDSTAEEDNRTLLHCRQIYERNMVLRKDRFYQGLESLRRFADIFVSLILDENAFRKEADELFACINGVINSKKVQKYQIEQLEDNQEELLDILVPLMDQWNQIRGVIGKLIYSSRYNENSCKKCAECVKMIQEKEEQLFIKIINKAENQMGGNKNESGNGKQN